MKGTGKAYDMLSAANGNETVMQTGSRQESTRVVSIPYIIY